ncbi:MAG TPA: GNAT family N-acetyltransferase [Nevskiaceae bacterium]|nr:GNAT family N-acetyltransferase [Nevskiaceae bacterium]
MNPAAVLRLRLAQAADLPRLAAYVAAFHALEGLPAGGPSLAVLQPLLGESPHGRLWLIELDEAPAGYLAITFGYSIEFGGRDAFIDELFLLPEHRGRGLGRAVLEQLRRAAAALGLRALHLEVARGNERAQRLYHEAGYRPRPQFTLMSLPLDPSPAPGAAD